MLRSALVPVVACSVMLRVAACSSFGGDERESGATDAASDAPGADSASGADAGPDGSTSDAASSDATMVPVPTSAGAFYWIDATEVTVREFEKVKATVPWPKGQSTVCPDKVNWRSGSGECSRLNVLPDEPANCVDWCAAKAYCQAVGKRLCGRIDGGEVPQDQGLNTNVDQWHRACAGPSNRKQPYGPVYMPRICNDDAPDGGPAPVATYPVCVGSVPGLHDMVGNLNEWEDLCFTPAGGTPAAGGCAVRGGAWSTPAAQASCMEVHAAIPSSAYDDVGFRCCRDEMP